MATSCSHNTGDTYRYDLDMLKALAIIAVVLYHAGYCKSGYLGVDVFLVLNGYFVIPRIMQLRLHEYFSFLEKRIFRLLPLVLLVGAFALSGGYWAMLPGDYRFLSEETIAASLFGENMLQAVTTQNYWAAIYHKVMMHTWFLGVLFQFYLVFPLLMLLAGRRRKLMLIVLTVLSLLLFLLPVDTIGNKYYLLPYRFFELTSGGLVAMQGGRRSDRLGRWSLCCLLFMIFFGAFTIGERMMPYNLEGGTNTIRDSFLPRELLLLLTVGATLLFLQHSAVDGQMLAWAKRSEVLAPLGKMSLSVFLWHQPLFAFYRYSFNDNLSPIVLLSLVALALLLSYLSYHFVEQRVRPARVSRIALLSAFLVVNAFAMWVYGQGGVVRDVPELDIRRDSPDPTAFERYTDRIYQYDREFDLSDTIRRRVLIVGNSFARDFANILLESADSDRIQIAYRYSFDDCPLSRVRQCDRIYFFGWKHLVPNAVWSSLSPDADVWGIGTKNHGLSNGVFYKHRYSEDYFTQRTAIRTDFHNMNRLLSEKWQGKYVDLLSLVVQSDSTVPVFTPDHHFITYDGRHLTPAGTRYYAKLLGARKRPS